MVLRIARVLQMPRIDCVERRPGNARLDFAVPESLQYFDGHFPGCPLLPGVVQIGWAIELAREYIGFDAQFRSLAAVKFMRVIQPGANVTLLLDFDAQRRELEFEYQLASEPCSNGRALFQ